MCIRDRKESKDGAPSTPNPHAKTLMIGVAILITIVCYIYFVYIPTQKDLQIKNDKIAQIETIKFEIATLSSEIIAGNEKLALAQVEYERRSALFHTDKEMEDMYGQISLLAMQNKLTVTKIQKGTEIPVFADGSCASSNNLDDESEPMPRKVGYYEFVVDLEISGNYNFYTSFRNGLAQLKKIININNESIIVLDSEGNAGSVRVTSSISTYRLPKNEAEQCI